MHVWLQSSGVHTSENCSFICQLCIFLFNELAGYFSRRLNYFYNYRINICLLKLLYILLRTRPIQELFRGLDEGPEELGKTDLGLGQGPKELKFSVPGNFTSPSEETGAVNPKATPCLSLALVRYPVFPLWPIS